MAAVRRQFLLQDVDPMSLVDELAQGAVSYGSAQRADVGVSSGRAADHVQARAAGSKRTARHVTSPVQDFRVSDKKVVLQVFGEYQRGIAGLAPEVLARCHR